MNAWLHDVAILCSLLTCFSSVYLHALRNVCRIDKGSVEVLRKLDEIGVPDSDNAQGEGDLLDAMVVALHMMRTRTFKR